MSQSDTSSFGKTGDKTARAQEGLDERIYHLKTLYEASREIPGLVQPKKITEAFLLTSMGVTGATRGLVIFYNTHNCEGDPTLRGISDSEAVALQEQIPSIGKYYFSPEYISSSSTQSRNVHFVQQPLPDFLPAHMDIIVKAMVDDTYGVLVGLGKSLKESPFKEADMAAVLHLSGTLMQSLAQTLGTQRMHQLNAELIRQSEGLQEALQRADQACRESDRRTYNLKTLYELTAELSPITESGVLLETFLLMVMGAVGTGQGSLLLLDRENRAIRTVGRGMATNRNWPVEAAEKVFYQAFQAAENRRLAPKSVTFIRDPQSVLPESDTGVAAHTALLFTVEESLLGLVVLGCPIDKTPLDPEQRDLLSGLTSGFMVFLQNVRAYETVKALNTDLSRTNEQLRQTISDLTEARHQIRILEVAKTQLKQLVQHEVDRLGWFRPIDLFLIIMVASLVAFLFNFSNPNGIPLFPEGFSEAADLHIHPRLARELVTDGDALVVDARPQELFKRKHLPEAINVPATLFDIIYPMKLGSKLRPGQTLVVYGRTISKHYDREVASRILQRHDAVKVLEGGISAWEKEGYPVAP